MPKNKSHKGILKRIRVTATGKVKHKKCGHKHLRSGKSGETDRDSRRPRYLSLGEAKRLEKLLHRRLRGRNQPRTAIRRSPSPEDKRAAREAAAKEAESKAA